MEDEAELQKVFKVWPGYDGASLEVMIDGDGMLRIRTKDKKSEEYFGTMNVSLEPRVASKLADAIKELVKGELK